MSYYPLNVKTGYTFFASSIHPEDLVSFAKKSGHDTICVTDHNNLFASLEIVDLAKKNKLKYVLGMEISLQEGENNYPLILLIKDQAGYQSLTRLSKIVSCDDLKATVSYDQLVGKLAGLIVIIPALRSQLFTLYQENRGAIPKYFEKMQQLSPDVYLGLECYHYADLEFLNYCRTLPYPKCIANSARYYQQSEQKILDVLTAIFNNSQVSEYHDYNEALDNETFLKSVFSEEELALNGDLLKQTSFDIFAKKAHLIHYPVEGVSQKEFLKDLCYKGLAKRLNNQITPKYQERLDYELSVIDKMGYTNYFLVVWDYVKYAKENGILVGPGRGSGAGALTSYVLGITDVDSLKYDLLFERFLNPERVSMPDLDVDFIDNRREDVVSYLFAKYSSEHVAHVVAFQTYQMRQSLRDAAKALGKSNSDVNSITKMIPEYIRGGSTINGLKDAYTKVPAFKKFIDERSSNKEIFEVACCLEDLPRQTTHIAGVVLCDEVLEEVVPVYHAGDIYTTQFSKNYVEQCGLLKMDILSLTDLAVISDTVANIKAAKNIDIDLTKIDYDDPKTYELINACIVGGVFQIAGAGMTKAIRKIKPTCLNDLVALIALFRPGPMDFIDDYAKCKSGEQQVDYIDPCLKDILAPTYGIIVYQEQIMQVLQVFAGFSLGEADIVRRAISKKSQEAMANFKTNFVTKALAKGHDQAVINKVYALIARFASYGFNKAHSVSYAMITATMAYLKAHYPVEFYCACLDRYNGNNNESVFFKLIEEMQRINVSILPPRINKSSNHFISENNGVRFSYQNIKGISNVSLETLLMEQNKAPFKDFYDFMRRVYGKGLNIGQVNNLIDAGVFDEFGASRATLHHGLEDVINYLDLTKVSSGQLRLDTEVEQPLLREIKDDPTYRREQEIAVLGSYFTGFSFEEQRAKFKRNGYLTIAEAKAQKGYVKIVAYARSVSLIRTKRNELMALISGADKSGQISIVIFPTLYNQVSTLIKKGTSFYLAGNVQQRTGQELSLIVDKIAEYKESGVAK